MSDKDIEKRDLELEKPDFSLDLEDDELDLSMDDELFEGNQEEKDDDLLSEDELESLIIGIDEENDILDIPDEEEVLEELKFLDENFLLDEEEEEVVEEKPKEKKLKKVKLPDFDIKYFIMKNRFKILIGFGSTVLFTILLVFFLLRDTKAYVEDGGKVERVVEANTKVEEMPLAEINDETIEELSVIEQLAYFRKKKKDYIGEGKDTSKVEEKLKILEAELEEEKKEARDVYIGSLKEEYTNELQSIKPTLFKSTDDTLIMGFVMLEEDFYDDLYNSIEKAFWKKRELKNININIFRVEDQLKKTHEVQVARHQFDAIRELNESNKEKIMRLNFVSR